MGTVGTLPLEAPTAVRSCRRCGCTDAEACVLEVNGPDEVTCSWVDDDLCSRCIRDGELTGPQRHEIARIEARWGPVRVTVGFDGDVYVVLERHSRKLVVETIHGGKEMIDSRPPTLMLNRRGRVLTVSNPVIHSAGPQLEGRRDG